MVTTKYQPVAIVPYRSRRMTEAANHEATTLAGLPRSPIRGRTDLPIICEAKSNIRAPSFQVESDSALLSLIFRMILSEKSATFRDHALGAPMFRMFVLFGGLLGMAVCSSPVCAAPEDNTVRPLGIGLEELAYPYPVEFLDLVIEGQALRMA
jgi:hypothetical protein